MRWSPSRAFTEARRRGVGFTLALAALGWFAALMIAPSTLAHPGSSPGAVRLASLVYVLGSVVCHQAPERSFHVAGIAQPVCARCVGLYAAVPVGLLAALLVPRRRTGRQVERRAAARRMLILTALPTGATLILEHGLGLPVAGWIRALAAVPIATAVGWVVIEGLLGAFDVTALEYTVPAER